MYLEYILLEFVLILAAGLSLLWGNKGIVLSWVLLTGINYLHHSWSVFLFWEVILFSFSFLGVILNTILNHKTKKLRVIKVTAGSTASLFASAIFLPFIPAFLLWSGFLAIPLVFTYREIPRALVLQIIFKFIFSSGCLIIGNILY